MERIKNIMELNVSNLAEKQYKVLKDCTIDILSTISTLIKKDKIDEALKMLEYSPAGDGYGSNNRFIDFSIMEVKDVEDIGNVLDLLSKLKKIT